MFIALLYAYVVLHAPSKLVITFFGVWSMFLSQYEWNIELAFGKAYRTRTQSKAKHVPTHFIRFKLYI